VRTGRKCCLLYLILLVILSVLLHIRELLDDFGGEEVMTMSGVRLLAMPVEVLNCMSSPSIVSTHDQ
jgi:hypothetical protein